MIKTTVINIKDAPPDWKENDKYVYIGRGSKWGNAYRINKHQNRNDVCELYEHNFSLQKDIHELRGKVLVCFCKPKRCHGDFLANLANKDFT